MNSNETFLEMHQELIDQRREIDEKLDAIETVMTAFKIRFPSRDKKKKVAAARVESKAFKTFKCPFCPKRLPTRRGRNTHIARMHKDDLVEDK